MGNSLSYRDNTLLWLFVLGTILGALVVGLVFTNRFHELENTTIRIRRTAPAVRPTVRQSAPAVTAPSAQGGYAPQAIGPSTGY